MDWTNDDGSSDEGSVDEQPIARQRKPSQDRTDVPPQQQQQASSAPPPRQSRQQNTRLPDRPPYMAFVGNLNYHLDEDHVGNFFHNGGCKVKDVQIPMKDGQSRGIAHVEFHDRDSLAKALTAHDTVLEKRSITVSVSEKRGGGKGGGAGRGDDRYARDKGRGDRRDRGDRDRGGHHRDSGRDDGWSRGENRGRGNNRDLKPTQRGTVAASTSTSTGTVPATRPKLDLKPRQAPMDTIGERVSNSSIFGEGKAREEVTPTAAASVTKKVKDMTIDSEKANNSESTDTANKSSTTAEVAGSDKKKDQRTARDRDSNKKDRNTPRDRDNKKDSRDRKADARKGNTPKAQGQSQDRKTPSGGDAKHPKKGKADKDTSESAEKARFEAANEKMRKPVAEVTQPKAAGGFFALMSDDDDDSDDSN